MRIAVWRDTRLLGWLAVGLLASVVELLLLRLLHDGLNIGLPIATAAAAEALIVVKFGVSDRWVFGHSWPSMDRALRYHGACAGALLVYWIIINAASAALGVPYVLGFVLATAAAFGWSLATNFLWVWAR